MQAEEQDKLRQAREHSGSKSRFKRQLLGYNMAAVDGLYAEYEAISARNSRAIQELTDRERLLQGKNRELTEQMEEWEQSVRQQYEKLDELTTLPLRNQIADLQEKAETLTAERNTLTAQLASVQETLRQTENLNCILKEKLLRSNAQLTSRNLAIQQARGDLSLQLDQLQGVCDELSGELCRLAKRMLDQVETQTERLRTHRESGAQALQTLYEELHPQSPAYPEVLSVGSLKIQSD